MLAEVEQYFDSHRHFSIAGEGTGSFERRMSQECHFDRKGEKGKGQFDGTVWDNRMQKVGDGGKCWTFAKYAKSLYCGHYKDLENCKRRKEDKHETKARTNAKKKCHSWGSEYIFFSFNRVKLGFTEYVSAELQDYGVLNVGLKPNGGYYAYTGKSYFTKKVKAFFFRHGGRLL